MNEFINTSYVIGDDALVDSLIMRTITEYKEDRITKIGSRAFYGCTALQIVDAPNVTFLGSYAFQECNSLTLLNLPNLKDADTYAFSQAAALQKLKLPKLTYLRGFSLDGCAALEMLDLGSATQMDARFYSNTKLTTIILRNPDVVCSAGLFQLDVTPIGKGLGYIYVPSILIESYKIATNWSAYASQLRILEDYTIDGTITGELDETKI